MKSSITRGIRQKVLEQYPAIAPVLDDIIPKKLPLIIAKWYTIAARLLICSQDHLNLVIANNEIVFFNERDGPYYPVLRLLHKCMFSIVFYSLDPFIMPTVQVDRGAIKFVMQGANIMCPGLTSAGTFIFTISSNI